jgi:hypothetical protein
MCLTGANEVIMEDQPTSARPVPVTLKGKKRLLKVRGGQQIKIRKTPSGVEIEGLDIEGISTPPCEQSDLTQHEAGT